MTRTNKILISSAFGALFASSWVGCSLGTQSRGGLAVPPAKGNALSRLIDPSIYDLNGDGFVTHTECVIAERLHEPRRYVHSLIRKFTR